MTELWWTMRLKWGQYVWITQTKKGSGEKRGGKKYDLDFTFSEADESYGCLSESENTTMMLVVVWGWQVIANVLSDAFNVLLYGFQGVFQLFSSYGIASTAKF